MKQYGAKKATEFSRKQIGIVWAKAKSGELKVEKWFISELYDLADYYGYDDNHSIENQEREVKAILEAVFAGDNEKAQELIDWTADSWFDSFSRSRRERCDRSIFVD